MIGNLSFEEHVRHFTEMYNHLKSVNQHLDDETIINTIYSKVMIVQEWENVVYNLNIENVYDTAMVKDFEKWLNQFYLHNNNGNNNNNSGDELRSQDDDDDSSDLQDELEDEELEDDDKDEELEDDDDEDEELEDDELEEEELDDDSQYDALDLPRGEFVRCETFPPEIPDDY